MFEFLFASKVENRVYEKIAEFLVDTSEEPY